MIVGFTGTRTGLTDKQWDLVDEIIWKLDSTVFHHGQCEGADEEAARIAYGHGFTIISHPPTDKRYGSLFDENDEVREAKPYLERNRNIVDECDVLVAAPNTSSMPDRLLGQGTWSTVAYALKHNKPVLLCFPDGTLQKYNMPSNVFRLDPTRNAVNL